MGRKSALSYTSSQSTQLNYFYFWRKPLIFLEPGSSVLSFGQRKYKSTNSEWILTLQALGQLCPLCSCSGFPKSPLRSLGIKLIKVLLDILMNILFRKRVLTISRLAAIANFIECSQTASQFFSHIVWPTCRSRLCAREWDQLSNKKYNLFEICCHPICPMR